MSAFSLSTLKLIKRRTLISTVNGPPSNWTSEGFTVSHEVGVIGPGTAGTCMLSETTYSTRGPEVLTDQLSDLSVVRSIYVGSVVEGRC